MKTQVCLLGIICILLPTWIVSQTVEPQNDEPYEYESVFGKESTSWNLLLEVSDAYLTDSICILNDTTINNILYKETSTTSYGPCFLRESADRSKVYLFAPERSSSEFLVMDLTLQQADTFFLDKGKYYAGQPDTIIVDSIYWFENKKHIRFNREIEYVGGMEKFEFIESVGSNFGLLYPGANSTFMQKYNYLLCSHKDEKLTYSNKSTIFSEQCNVFQLLNAQEIKNDRLSSIFPNPSSGIFTVDLVGKDFNSVDVSVYDLGGILAKRIKASNSTFDVDLSDAPTGLYYIVMLTQNEIITNKIIVRR